MILVSKFMVHRALSDKTYLSLLSPLYIDEFSDKNFESDEKTTLLQGMITLSLLTTIIIHFNFCCLLMSSTDNLCKQFAPRSGLKKCQA